MRESCGVERRLIRRDRRTRPGLLAKMERILMSFGLILILEPVVAVCTCVLLLVFMRPRILLSY